MSSPPQMSGPVVLVQQLNGNSDGPVHYVSITEEQLRGLTIGSTAVVKAGLEHKIQENQVIDFLALNEDVQFIKTESCVPSPSADGSADFGGDVDVSVIDTFDASPLLHEASKDVALTNLQENLANLPALHADENAGASNAEYETEDLLLAQLQAQQGTVQRDGEEAMEVDDDERAASEYLNDGQLYLEKSKRLDNFVHHPQSALKCQQQQQQQQQHHHQQQLQHQHQQQQQQHQQQQQPQHMDCTSTNLIETSSTAEDGAVRCSSEAQTDVAEVSSTTLDPSTTSPTHPDNTISASRAPPPTLNIVDSVASSTPAVLTDNKIRVVSFSGANILTSAGEPVLLGNFLLVPGTSTMKLQIVQEASAGSMKEVSVRGVGSDGGLSQTALGLDGLTLSNISLLSQGLNLQNGLVGHQDKKSQRPFQCKLCTATFTRLGNYTRHQKIHTVRSKEDERFHCKECGKSFIQRCDLTRHLHVHAGTEPHRCDRCGKGYIRHSDLVTHQRFHNKEKPFVCDHCQKGFSQRGDLNRHMRSIHLQIRPLTCNHCQKKFAKEATLIRHTRTSHREIVLANWGLKTGGDPDSISEALITGTGDVCSPTALGIRD